MKILSFARAATVILLFTLCGYAANAQYTLNPVTVSVTQPEFAALDLNGSISVNMMSYSYFVGDGMMNTGPGPGPVFDPEPPCPEQMTPELYEWLLQRANAQCRDIKICLQGADCNYYLYLIKPTAPNCIYLGIGPYQPLLSAYRLP